VADAGGDAASADAGMDAAPGDAGPGTLDATAPGVDAGPDDASAPDAQPVCGPAGIDCCPDDPSKTAPGVCGCGVPDLDGDEDGTLDCEDLCASDPDKAAPGECGCGLPETRSAECSALAAVLRHRYRFDGTGAIAFDSVSGADGMIVNAMLDGSSTLPLAGGTTNQYVDLPDGIVSALSNATFEVWLSWRGGSAWQRIFDFGTSNGGAGSQGSGVSYIFLTPQSSSSMGAALRGAFSLSGSANEEVVLGSAALDTDVLRHVALVVVDQSALRLYVDGVLLQSAAFGGSLADIDDVNNWLGRSQFGNDAEIDATYHEVRIYDAALTDQQIEASFDMGPDPPFL
jgi:hypothetical protein